MRAIGLAAAAFLSGAAAADSAPRVEIDFPNLIERYCAELSVAPDPEVVAELRRRLPELRAAWEREGPALMAETARLAGRPYRFRETIAVLHACEDLGSLSRPLLIAAARYTDAWARRPGRDGAARSRRPDADFVNSVWHETNHRYVTAIVESLPGATTPARERHARESIVVRNHLHLFALEELVWTRLGRRDEFEARRARVEGRGDRELARAYALVRQEGAEALVAELRPGG